MMRKKIDRTIVEYVNISKQYKSTFFLEEKELLGHLNWDLLLLCVFLSLPVSCLKKKQNIEDSLTEMEFLLKYCNVEVEASENAGEEEKVRIKGYVLSEETGHIPCFYMLCLLIYCHVITNEQEKKSFLQCMLIAPGYDKVSLFSEEDRVVIIRRLKLLQMPFETLEVNQGRKQFDIFLRKYGMSDVMKEEDCMDLIDIRNMASRGLAFFI